MILTGIADPDAETFQEDEDKPKRWSVPPPPLSVDEVAPPSSLPPAPPSSKEEA